MGNTAKYIKLDTDDILEIVLEHYQDKMNCASASGVILGTPGKDLRLIGVFGCEEDDEIYKIDLAEMDKKIEYNGDHSFLKNHPEFYL